MKALAYISPHRARSLVLFRFLDAVLARLVPRAGILEERFERAIPFVTRVFEHALVGLPHRDGGAPRLRPGAGIADRELVEQRVGAGACEALDEVHLVGGPAVLTEGQRADAEPREVRRLDDQRVLLPAAPRDARVLADGLRGRGPVVERH